MGAAAREGDFVFCPADVHPFASPVPVVGVITAASPNTFINSKKAAIANPALTSQHKLCVGPNTFFISGGSLTHFINSFPAARSGDPTTHCGGLGSILPFCSLDTFFG
jgi:uncharacterized Zn-binding protein involved in type VI secretion